MRHVVGLLCLLGAIFVVPGTARAEWQFRPFAGITFGGSTTYVDFDHAAGHPKFAFGGSALLQGEVLGIEADVGNTPGYFNGDENLVLSSRVSTVTGNVVVALPKKIAQYTLRPYLVAGAGLMHVTQQDYFAAFVLSHGLLAMDIGAGATGFLSEHVGVNWDIRLFRSLSGEANATALHPDGPERLSTWRATMGFVIRP